MKWHRSGDEHQWYSAAYRFHIFQQPILRSPFQFHLQDRGTLVGTFKSCKLAKEFASCLAGGGISLFYGARVYPHRGE